MIKTVYIHIGYPKAASSSIQESLVSRADLLKECGYLFPVLNINGRQYSNHSIFFHNLFSNSPQPSNINIRNEITSEAKRISFVSAFENQFGEQLKSFQGDNLIFSGEGIIHMRVDEVKKMKDYFIQKFGPDLKFCLLVITRNPVARIQSNIQQAVKAALPLSFERIYKINNLFSRTLSVFLKFFSVSDFIILRLEDISSSTEGAVGELLLKIGFPEKLISKFPNLHINKKLSYEAVLLLSSINERVPFMIDGKYNQARKHIIINDFKRIPGQKFTIEKYQQEVFWRNCLDDVKWISETFACKPYEFSISGICESNKRWSRITLKAIKDLLKKQNKNIGNIIIMFIFNDLKGNFNTYHLGDKVRILYFILKEKFQLLQRE
ncbi:MAG: hypothetical protein JW798_01895 [Prolixibacteraceae bacterium]|nr:hypothetical protein [Prolixibacteraceae bacterium]